MHSRLLRLILIVSLAKLIGAAYWPVNGEEVLLWANARSGTPLGGADVFSALAATLISGTGPLQLLLLRLPGLIATTLCLVPLNFLAQMLGRDSRVAGNCWLALHCIPGVCLASLGWNREGLMLLVGLSTAAAGLAGARGSKLGATMLGWIAGLSLLVHPFAPLTAACALAWPREKSGPNPAAPRWRVLQGLLPGILLVGLINKEASWERVLHLRSSLDIGFDFSALLSFSVDTLLWTGAAFMFLAIRSWNELQRKQIQGALTLRVAAFAPLIILFYLGCQGALDGRLALTSLVVAILPGLLSPDLPPSLRRKLARISAAITLGLMGLVLAASWFPGLGVPLAKLTGDWIERTPAARPMTRAMLPDLEQRVPPGTRIGGEDPLQAAMFSFLGESLGDPVDLRWTRPLPSMALLLLESPEQLQPQAGLYSTTEMLPPVRVPVRGSSDQVLWIGLALDPQGD
jgi:hypothetical protein